MKESTRLEYQVLSLAAKTARIMLESSSEVHRIERITQRICQHYHFSAQCFATLTCVIITLENKEGELFSLVDRIENRNTNLHKISRISKLVDNISVYSYSEFKEELEHIRKENTYSQAKIFFAHILGASCFVFLFQGDSHDAFVSGLTGFFIALTSYLYKKMKLESLFLNGLQGFVASAIPCWFYSVGWISKIDVPIISSLMIMVPGVAFINSIRDLFSGDLVTAQSRLLEVILIGMTLAVGSGIALKFFYI